MTERAALPPLELRPGRYWFDLFPADREPFAAWTAEQGDRVFVRARAAQPGELEWVLFDVRERALWPLPGRPTPASADVRGPDDVISRPAREPDPLWTDPFSGGVPWGWLAVGGGALLGLGWLAGRR